MGNSPFKKYAQRLRAVVGISFFKTISFLVKYHPELKFRLAWEKAAHNTTLVVNIHANYTWTFSRSINSMQVATTRWGRAIDLIQSFGIICDLLRTFPIQLQHRNKEEKRKCKPCHQWVTRREAGRDPLLELEQECGGWKGVFSGNKGNCLSQTAQLQLWGLSFQEILF